MPLFRERGGGPLNLRLAKDSIYTVTEMDKHEMGSGAVEK
jgi:hypothetical protein